MIKLLNLDISGTVKSSDLALKKDSEYDIYFRIHDDGYDINYDNFNNLRLTVRVNKTTITDVININADNIISYNGKNYIMWTIPMIYLKDEALLLISATVNYNNSNKKAQDFVFQIYEKSSPELNGMLIAIDKYNTAIGLYLDSIKISELNNNNGVVGLESNGKIHEDRFNPIFSEHIPTKLIDTIDKVDDIHGLRLENNKLEYYDNDDLEFYIVNQIHGGQLGFKNKSSEYNIFGGDLESYRYTIDAMTFNTEIPDTIDGGNLNDNTENYIDGGIFNMTNTEDEDRYLNRIHGGFL